MTHTGELLSADSTGKRLGTRRVLTAATVSVTPGRIVALLGRNGCGKTTLLRIMAGLLRPDYGTVTFLGQPQRPARLHRLALRGLFFVPERDLLSPVWPVGDHIDALARRFKHTDPDDAIDRMQIRSLLDRPASRLSTGERRRCELTLAIIRQPRCLLADELFMGIAPKDAELLVAEIRKLAAAGTGVVVTGHEVDVLLEVADDVVWMTSGTTHWLGSPEQAVRYDQFRREYLGPASGLMLRETAR